MYEYIKGRIDFVCPEYVTIDNGGIGYQIGSPNPFIYADKIGKEVQIFTYQHVRQDVMALYGFQSRDEKMLFIKLISVSGIGPKGALAILATGEPEQVVRAIESEDEVFLVKFPGVGKKTARQIILDLKGKLEAVLPNYFTLVPSHVTDKVEAGPGAQALEEAIMALQALGYSEREIKRIMPKLQTETYTTDEYIKLALQQLLK